MAHLEISSDRLQIYALNTHGYRDTFAHDVAQGLSASRKSLPAKYFYDAYGRAAL